MSKTYTYSGHISFGFTVESDEPLDREGIILGIADNLTDMGVPYDSDLGEYTTYINGQEQD